MSDRSNSVAAHEPFVYGKVGTDLWFMPLRKALEWASNHASLAFATTWGDLLSRLSRKEARWVLEDWRQRNKNKSAPPKDAPLTEQDRNSIIGDWCEWHHTALTMMVDWLPKEALEDFSVERISPEAIADVLAGDEVNTDSREQWLSEEDRKVGWIEDSFANGECLMLPAHREEAVVAHFSKFGIKCVRNDALIQWAHGQWLYGDEQADFDRMRDEDGDAGEQSNGEVDDAEL